MEITERKRSVKRRSLITDVIIIFFVIVISVLLTRYLNANNEKTEDKLYLKELEPFERNSLLIDKIYNEYGVRIIYGQDSILDAEKVNATIQDDDYVVYNNLVKIYEVFKQYPEDYFKNNNLTIVILDKFVNNNIALASRNTLNQYKIYITNARSYERALNHEMFHVFEYMLDTDFRKIVDDQWYAYNPENFTYESSLSNIDYTYVFSEETAVKDAYFVSRYSKVSAKEDRAEIFAEMMRFSDEKQQYLTEDGPIIKKARYVLSLLDMRYGHDINNKWSI